MEIQELQTLVAAKNWKDLAEGVESEAVTKDYATWSTEYDSKQHDIHDQTIRKDKPAKTEMGDVLIPVARLSIPLQKRIVHLAAAFLCGNKIELLSKPKGAEQEAMQLLVQKVWDDNKMDYFSQTIARHLFAETDVAELWYTEDADPDYWADTPIAGAKKRIRMKILARSLGDQLFPVFNNNGDMIAFGRQYTVEDETGKDEQHFDIYTDNQILMGVKAGEGWLFDPIPNGYKKIPIIYYSQDRPEWSDVQEMIDRYETTISNHADTNDYNGAPIITVQGKITGFAKKGETGKILEMEPGSTAQYISWDQSPESMKLEFQNIRSLIHDMSDTPDISFENMKSLGTYSGIALKMLFMAAHMKASAKEENFGVGVQRRINYFKAIISRLSNSLAKGMALNIKPKFEYFLPRDYVEIIDLLSTATAGKQTMSRKTAVAHNPLVIDAEQELVDIKTEEKEAGALQQDSTSL